MDFRSVASPNNEQTPHVAPLTRQGSLYNLTLEEVQNHLRDVGKPVSSMNLEELLKTVIAAEESQLIHGFQTGNPPPSSSSAPLPGNNINLTGTLSQKTVNEVWKEIVESEMGTVKGESSIQRQPTLGEMTLEDFLLKAGAINKSNQHLLGTGFLPLLTGESRATDAPPQNWLQQYQMAAAAVHPPQSLAALSAGLPVAGPVFANNAVAPGYAQCQLGLSVPPAAAMVGSSSSESHAAVERKQRSGDEMLEKTIERRQKRMIKNRESAARSRQRKQAHTNLLEQQVADLRKTKVKIRKELDFDRLSTATSNRQMRYQLRRTTSV